MSELRHKLKMQQMQLDECESLKFDIEMLTDEKGLLEEDLTRAQIQLKEAEGRVSEAVKAASDARQQCEGMVRAVGERYEGLLAKERQDGEERLMVRNAEAERQIEEIHEKVKAQMIPALKEKYQAKY